MATCQICKDSKRLKLANQLIAEGLADGKIAARLGLPAGPSGNTGRMMVQRHRVRHVAAVARAVLEAADKGSQITAQRKEVIEAAQRGDTAAAFLGLEAIASDLRATSERLERVSAGAETDGQRTAVAALAGQQLRSAEVRSRLGGHGGYAPQRGPAGGAEQPMFSIVMHFSGHQPQSIDMAPVIDAERSESSRVSVGVPVMRRAGRLIPAPRDGEDDEWGDVEEDV